jgi:predicted lipoprotein
MSDPGRAAPIVRSSPLAWPWLAGAAMLVLLFTAYPPFHVVSRPGTAGATPIDTPAGFAPAAFATQFWAAQLQPAAARAPDLVPVLTALCQDPIAAAKTYAHRVGLGHAAFYFVRGTGRITAVERSRLLVEVDGVAVAIRTGPVFGNVLRDGCGLLDVNQVPGLAEFNALSAELNRLVEARVQPSLKSAAVVGATLVFAGCAEAPESLPATDAPLLTFIPVHAEVKP